MKIKLTDANDVVQIEKSDGTIIDLSDIEGLKPRVLNLETNSVLSTSIRNVVVCTLSLYDTLVTNNLIDANTEYNIIEELLS